MTDEFILSAAWAHDVLEDSQWTAGDLLDGGLPREVVEIVKHLTRPKNDKRPRDVRVSEMIEKMSIAPYNARIIKLADRCDNLGDVAGDAEVPADFALQYADESVRLLGALHGTNAFLENRLTLLITQIKQRYGKGT
jgi:(p)ppGpp synthase/HD superfamily hydrolase